MLKLKGVDVSYGPVSALRSISIEVKPGTVVAIIGANGAGKSSTLKTIAGLAPAAAGSVFFMDQDITNMPAHRRPALGMALSPEGRGVFPDQRLRDNLMLGAYSRRHDKEGIASGIARAFQLYPILDKRQDQPRRSSARRFGPRARARSCTSQQSRRPRRACECCLINWPSNGARSASAATRCIRE